MALSNQFDNIELEKSKPHIIVEILEYIPSSVLIKTIIKKTTGNITVTAVDAGEELAEKTSPFDTFIQIIDGAAQVEIRANNISLGWAKESSFLPILLIALALLNNLK